MHYTTLLRQLGRATAALAFLAIAPLAKANLLLFDPFNYTSGTPLIGQVDTNVTPNQTWFATGTGTVGVGPSINSSNLSLPSSSYPSFPASTGNSVNINAGGSTKDNWAPRISLGTTISNSAVGTVYYSLLAQLPSGLPGNGTAGTFFAGFNNSTGSQTGQMTVTGADLLIHANGTAGYSFGIFNGASATRSYADSKVFSPGDTVLIVASYTFGPGTAGDVANLWVDPPDSTLTNGMTTAPIVLTPDATDTGDMTTTASANLIKSFFLRDNSFEPSSGGINVDEVRVWTVPEPASLSLLSLATGGLLMRRRGRAS